MSGRITKEDDDEVERILAMTDAEIEEALWATGELLEDVSDRMQALFKSAFAEADRRRRALN